MDEAQGYSDTDHGRVHWRCWPARAPGNAPPLVLLHPMPHDGTFFAHIAPLLAEDRRVFAPDYPGYGRSDPLDQAPSIPQYAEACLQAFQARYPGVVPDLFGFHSGCLVGPEMARLQPASVRRLVLVDVPLFSAEKRAEMLRQDWAVGGFRAAFEYQAESTLAALEHPCLVIATQSNLLEPSREAANLLRHARWLEFPEVVMPALETGSRVITDACHRFLAAADQGQR